MFSLIIAIVAIALVVALVIASGYFGGSAVTDAQAAAEATRLRNEEQQILAAVDMFDADNRRYPNDIQELVSAGYLSTAPAGAKLAQLQGPAFISSAYAALTSGWSTVSAGSPVFLTAANVNAAACAQYNKLSRGDDGILKQAYADLGGQCFGADGNYSLVIHKGGFNLASVLSGVRAGGAPASDAAGVWDKEPGAPVSAGSGSGGASSPDSGASAPASARLNLSSQAYDFGTVLVGQSATSPALTLTNSGGAAVTGLTISAPLGFSLSGNSCGNTLAAGANCSFSVDFAPTVFGAVSGNVSVVSANAGSHAVSVVGSGDVPQTTLSWSAPATRDMGIVASGTLLGYLQAGGGLITNNGSVDAKNLSVRAPTGAAVTWFAGSATTCPALLPAGKTCRVTVRHTPPIGPIADTVTVTAENSNTLSAAFTGTVVPPSRATVVGNASVTLANWYGSGYTSVKITYRNDGQALMSLFTPNLVSPLFLTANDCSGVQAGATCDVTVSLSGIEVFGGSGYQIFTMGTNQGSVDPVTLNWSIYTTTAQWGATTLDFGTVAPGRSATKSVTLTNNGNVAAQWFNAFGSVAQLNVKPENFDFDFSACSNVVPGGSCNVAITFSPAVERDYSSPELVLMNVSANQNSLSLTGKGAYTDTVNSSINKEVVAFGQYGTYSWTSTNTDSVTTTCSNGVTSQSLNGTINLGNEVVIDTDSVRNVSCVTTSNLSGAATSKTFLFMPWNFYYNASNGYTYARKMSATTNAAGLSAACAGYYVNGASWIAPTLAQAQSLRAQIAAYPGPVLNAHQNTGGDSILASGGAGVKFSTGATFGQGGTQAYPYCVMPGNVFGM